MVAPRVGSPAYISCTHELVDRARLHVRGWDPVPAEVEPAALADIGAILAAFRMRFIPEMLVDATLIKSLLDGSQAARTSRFGAVRQSQRNRKARSVV